MGVIEEQIQAMKGALLGARQMLTDQRAFIDKVTSPPLSLAVVVQVNKKRKLRIPKVVESTPATLSKINTRVRLIVGTRYFNQAPNVIGTVISNNREPGWVRVKWDDGGMNDYAIGGDSSDSDLEAVQEYSEPTCYISGGGLMEVWVPSGMTIKAGDMVSISQDTQQIVDKAHIKPSGSVKLIKRVIDNEFSEIDGGEGGTVIFNGSYTKKTLNAGDRVLLDPGSTVIVQNLGKDESKFAYTEKTGVQWSDIGGLEIAKKELIESVELPHKNPAIFKHYGKKPIKGVLLYGPPGCGKTMLGKATATSLASVSGAAEAETGFIYIKGPEILDRFVGVAEATIRQVFNAAREHRKKFGYPAVVFIDEADAIMQKRGTGISSDIEKTIVPMFLTEMDGLEDTGALIILATNRSDTLDPAIVRDGRIDRKIKVTRPDEKGAAEIFRLNLLGRPLDNGYSIEKLSEKAAKDLFSDKRRLYVVKVETRDSNSPIDRLFCLHHIINGGMVAGVVDKAMSYAMERDIENNKMTGIREEDLIAAIDNIETQNRDLNHEDELEQFVYEFRDRVIGVERVVPYL